MEGWGVVTDSPPPPPLLPPRSKTVRGMGGGKTVASCYRIPPHRPQASSTLIKRSPRLKTRSSCLDVKNVSFYTSFFVPPLQLPRLPRGVIVQIIRLCVASLRQRGGCARRKRQGPTSRWLTIESYTPSTTRYHLNRDARLRQDAKRAECRLCVD